MLPLEDDKQDERRQVCADCTFFCHGKVKNFPKEGYCARHKIEISRGAGCSDYVEAEYYETE